MAEDPVPKILNVVGLSYDLICVYSYIEWLLRDEQKIVDNWLHIPNVLTYLQKTPHTHYMLLSNT